jgi:hypothetical protein
MLAGSAKEDLTAGLGVAVSGWKGQYRCDDSRLARPILSELQ